MGRSATEELLAHHINDVLIVSILIAKTWIGNRQVPGSNIGWVNNYLHGGFTFFFYIEIRVV